MRAKSIFNSKVFAGAVVSIATGIISLIEHNYTLGITTIISGIWIIGARLSTNTRTYLKKSNHV